MIYNGRHSLLFDQNNCQVVIFESFCGTIKTFAALTYVDSYGCRYFWDATYGFGFALPMHSEFCIPSVEVFPNGIVAWTGPYTIPDLYHPAVMTMTSGPLLESDTTYSTSKLEKVDLVGSTSLQKCTPSISQTSSKSTLAKNDHVSSSEIQKSAITSKVVNNEGNTNVQGTPSRVVQDTKSTTLSSSKNSKETTGNAIGSSLVSVQEKSTVSTSKATAQLVLKSSNKLGRLSLAKECKCPRCELLKDGLRNGGKQSFRGKRTTNPRNGSTRVSLKTMRKTQMNQKALTSI